MTNTHHFTLECPESGPYYSAPDISVEALVPSRIVCTSDYDTSSVPGLTENSDIDIFE